MLLQQQIIQELQQIPDNKLAEIYDLIHYFRIGLAQENSITQTIAQRPIGLAKQHFIVPESFFEVLPDDILDAFEGY